MCNNRMKFMELIVCLLAVFQMKFSALQEIYMFIQIGYLIWVNKSLFTGKKTCGFKM